MQAQRQAELFSDPLEPRILPQAGWPFWTLNARTARGGMTQRAYRLHQMDWVLAHVRKDVDTYMSQAFFAQPSRRALHVAWMTHAYVDLDLYKLARVPPVGGAGILLRMFCADEGIPEPSLIVYSGRGFYVKWMWSTPLSRAAAGRAVAVNRALVKRFAAWGSDPAAVDVSRVLRVVGSTNSRSGDAARVVWQADRGSHLLTYDFEMFADEVLPYSYAEVREFRAKAALRQADLHLLSQERARRSAAAAAGSRGRAGQRAFSTEDWHWGVVEDLRRLANLRHGGPVPYVDQQQGLSKAGPDLFGHIGACQLARVVPACQLWPEIQAWGRLILPAEYAAGPDFHRHCSTLLRQAQAAAGGDTVQRGARRVTPVYTYRASTMIDRLEITPDEMRQMTRLIDGDEKRRRDREAWRASHTGLGREQWRAELSAMAHPRSQRARELRATGLTWQAVASEMGLAGAGAARSLAGRNADTAG